MILSPHRLLQFFLFKLNISQHCLLLPLALADYLLSSNPSMADLQSEVLLNLCEPSDHLNHSYSLRARKAAKNYDIFRVKKDDEVVQFGGGDQAGLRNMGDGDGSDSGYCSPPLWKPQPETKQQQLDYQHLSAEAKSQAVARGQRELMEMIKNMPESDYELTLQDLVERHRKPTGEEDEQKDYRTSDALFRKEEGDKGKNGSREIFRKQKKKRSDHKNIQKPVLRSSSINNNNGGFLLNLVLPLGFGFGNKKKMNPKATGLVSPKPLPPPVLDGGGKAVEKEWWKKRFAGSGNSLGMSSNNSRSTRSSGSSSSRSTRSINREKAGFGSGCWSCFGVKLQVD